jgi:hypothetical protein
LAEAIRLADEQDDMCHIPKLQSELLPDILEPTTKVSMEQELKEESKPVTSPVPVLPLSFGVYLKCELEMPADQPKQI